MFVCFYAEICFEFYLSERDALLNFVRKSAKAKVRRASVTLTGVGERKQVLTNRQAVVSPGIRDAEGGRADRRVSRMRQRRRLLLLLLRYPLTELRLHTWKLALQDRDATARRLDV